MTDATHIPRDRHDDYTETLAALRRAFVLDQTGVDLTHVARYTAEPHGPGKADKLAEICAAVALAGEVSLTSAVLHGDWVASHERLGRNRP